MALTCYAVSVKRCIRCGRVHARSGQKYCGQCHAAYMREWRKTHTPSEEERRRSNCRAYTRVLILRGQLTRQPCEECGIEPAQAHHPDYGNPRLVVWLCKDHHRMLHWRMKHASRFAGGGEADGSEQG